MEIVVDVRALPAVSVTVKSTFVIDPLVADCVSLTTLNTTCRGVKVNGTELEYDVMRCFDLMAAASVSLTRQKIIFVGLGTEPRRITVEYTTSINAQSYVMGDKLAHLVQAQLPAPPHLLYRDVKLVIKKGDNQHVSMPFGPPSGMSTDEDTGVTSGALFTMFQQATLFVLEDHESKMTRLNASTFALWRQEEHCAALKRAWFDDAPHVVNTLDIVYASDGVKDDFVAHVVHPTVSDAVALREAWISRSGVFRNVVVLHLSKPKMLSLQSTSRLTRSTLFMLLNVLSRSRSIVKALEVFAALPLDVFPTRDSLGVCADEDTTAWFKPQSNAEYSGDVSVLSLTRWALLHLPFGILPASNKMRDALLHYITMSCRLSNVDVATDSSLVATVSKKMMAVVPHTSKTHVITFDKLSEPDALASVKSMVHVWLHSVSQTALETQSFSNVFVTATPFLLQAGAPPSRTDDSKTMCLSVLLGLSPHIEEKFALRGGSGDIVAHSSNNIVALTHGNIRVRWNARKGEDTLELRLGDDVGCAYVLMRHIVPRRELETLLDARMKAPMSAREGAWLHSGVLRREKPEGFGSQTMTALLWLQPDVARVVLDQDDLSGMSAKELFRIARTASVTQKQMESVRRMKCPATVRQTLDVLAELAEVDVAFDAVENTDVVKTFIENQTAILLLFGKHAFCRLVDALHDVIYFNDVLLSGGCDLLNKSEIV